ncbi:MAG TPA: hypothetical protein VIT18_03025, partial [Terrimicrobiaceae bacterium]
MATAVSETIPRQARIVGKLFLVVLAAFLIGETWAQGLQKLLDSAKGEPSGQKSQPSAQEQKTWASEKLAQLQASEKAFDVEAFREELRTAGLPEVDADELLSALRESVRNYEAGIGTLAAVINSEARGTESSQPIPVPKDDSEVDSLRQRLAALRTQVQTAATQAKLDEETLGRQQSGLKTSNQELRRAQEEFDSAKTDQDRARAALLLKLAEARQETAASGAFYASWRLYADELDLHAGQAGIREIEQALSASGLDSIFNEKRARNAIQRIEEDKASVQGKVESAQLARQRLDESLSELDQTIKAATSEAERKQGETQLEIAREAREFAERIAAAGQAWIGGLDEALRMWKTTLAVAENPRPSTYVDARKAAEQLLSHGDPWREQIRRYLQSAEARLKELDSQPKGKDPTTSKLEELRLDLVRQ